MLRWKVQHGGLNRASVAARNPATVSGGPFGSALSRAPMVGRLPRRVAVSGGKTFASACTLPAQSHRDAILTIRPTLRRGMVIWGSRPTYSR